MQKELKDLNSVVTETSVSVDLEALSQRLILALVSAPPITPAPGIEHDSGDLLAQVMALVDEDPEGEPDLLGPE